MLRDPLRFLAELTGETLFAIDPHHLALAAVLAPQAADPGAGRDAPSAVSVLRLHGPLSARGVSYMGRTVVPGMDAFRADVARAAGDPNVGAIVLDVNSPGGTYAGTLETANAVREAAAVKPVIAVADTLAASAAYWIASQASEFVVTPSGDAGSIGVIAVHMSLAKMLEQEGVDVTVVRSRPGKADVNPFEALTDEARANLQGQVDTADGEFLKAVAQGRKTSVATVRETFGSGRTVSAKDAVKLGMADRVATMPQVLSGLVQRRSYGRRAAFAF